MTPTEPIPTDQDIVEKDILENSIDSNDDAVNDEDFNKDLPFESEYYRTSTDRDEFVRPVPGPEENEIDDGEGGIDLDESFSWNEQTPDCTYHIFIQKFYESIDRLEIKLEGLKLKSTAKSNLTLDEFIRDAQANLLESFKGKNLTNELVNDVITYLRQTFTSVYGYDDYCGVSTNVITYFMKNDTQNSNSYESSETNETDETDEMNVNESNEGVTDNPVETDSSTQIEADKEIEIENETETATEMATETETEYSTEYSSYSNEYSTEFSHISSDLVNVEVTDSDVVDAGGDVVDATTESYHSQVLKKPKLAAIIQESINFYKALHNWKFPPPSEF